jgi:hypothetical protein
MVLPVAAQWVLGIASFLTAFGIVFTFGRRVIKAIARFDAALPVLIEIAEQFHPERAGGKTLLDRIKHLEEVTEKIAQTTDEVKKVVNGGT